MPIVQSLMDSLVARYGEAKGKQVYYSMEAEGKGPFAPGAKHRDLHEAFAKKHGVTPSAATRTKKKPATPKGRRARASGAKRRR